MLLLIVVISVCAGCIGEQTFDNPSIANTCTEESSVDVSISSNRLNIYGSDRCKIVLSTEAGEFTVPANTNHIRKAPIWSEVRSQLSKNNAQFEFELKVINPDSNLLVQQKTLLAPSTENLQFPQDFSTNGGYFLKTFFIS